MLPSTPRQTTAHQQQWWVCAAHQSVSGAPPKSRQLLVRRLEHFAAEHT
ncbi:hypothetical protein SLBS1_A14 [Synechococcus phage S-LBS1]|nr:hypothetical protein SLBS1_A14 [Synechococcus phage S-LBS1]